jgi:hypothetical protein
LLLLAYADDLQAIEHDERTEVVAVANNMLPILWCSAFSADDLRVMSIHSIHGEEATCPALLTPLEQAKQGVAQRRDRFCTLFPRSFQGYYDTWANLVATLPAPYLLLRLVELWALFDDSAEFDSFLIACLRAFDTDDPDGWATLINQSWSLRFDAMQKRVTLADEGEDSRRTDLLGYGWTRPVPWKLEGP